MAQKNGLKLDIQKEFVHLARLCMDDKTADVAALLRKTLGKIAHEREDLEEMATAVLKKATSLSSSTRNVVEAPLPVDLDSRLELLTREFPTSPGAQPVWPNDVLEKLNSVALEREKQRLLEEHDLYSTRSILFVGPPGVGKTLAASWLARKLGWPLLTLDLSAVMSSFLGRTGNNLRTVLDFARRGNQVLLLDEFDAIAKRRDDSGEVGELKRLVTVLLQSIDNWPPQGLLIAATNHPELLDPAVWRRFERIVEFPMPSSRDIERLIGLLAPTIAPQDKKFLSMTFGDRSFADVERIIKNAKRESLIEDGTLNALFAKCLAQLCDAGTPGERVSVALRLLKQGYSQRAASNLTGVSRDTIRKKAAE